MIVQDFSINKFEDGVLTVSMTPPVPIGGWGIQWVLGKRLGGNTQYAVRNVTSGFNGASGISVINSGQGVFNISIQSSDTSGLDYGAYTHLAKRTDSGFITDLVGGYCLIPG